MEPSSLPPPLPVSVAGIDRTPRWHRLGTVVALAAIATAAVFIVSRGEERPSVITDRSTVTPNAIMNMVARYGYGVRLMLTRANQWSEEVAREVDRSLEPMTKHPVDQFRAEIVRGLMRDRLPSPAVLEEIETVAPSLQRDVEVLREIHLKGREVAEADWKWFLARHGWLARAARAQALPKSDPEWGALGVDATKTMICLAAATMGGCVAVLTGIVLLVLALLRWRRGQMPPAIDRLPTPWAGVLLEGFAIYLCGWSLVPMALYYFVPGLSRGVIVGGMILMVPVAVLWPLWRGMDRWTWKQSIGLHTGKGVWKEMGFGFLGWLAATPLIAVGIVLAQMIIKMTGVEMGHPIVEPLTSSGNGKWIAALLAVVWAPLAEECTFRGLLFPGLAARLRWIPSAIVGAFIFAVIHPQGWAAVPAIMAIAFAASMLRLVRGSLIAPMTLHAMNNGTLVLILILSAS